MIEKKVIDKINELFEYTAIPLRADIKPFNIKKGLYYSSSGITAGQYNLSFTIETSEVEYVVLSISVYASPEELLTSLTTGNTFRYIDRSNVNIEIDDIILTGFDIFREKEAEKIEPSMYLILEPKKEHKFKINFYVNNDFSGEVNIFAILRGYKIPKQIIE